MTHSILVPVDGSLFGEQALPVAMRIAQAANAKLQLAHVHVPVTPLGGDVPIPYDARVDALLQEGERAYLAKIVARIAEVSPITVAAELLDGPVEAAIGKHAAERNADLIVMTTHGRGLLARAWLGSVADALVRSIPTPMLLVHPRDGAPNLGDAPPVRHILIPLDGSALAERIVEPALALGTLFGADYTLVRVINPMVIGNQRGQTGASGRLDQALLDRLTELYEREQAEAARYLDGIAERFRARSLAVLTRVLTHEQPAVAILKEATDRHIDVIAIETHGRGGLSRLLLGSVADKIIRGASVPVLIQRPAAQDA